MQDASPGPGEQVGGTVDAVELDFLDPLLEAPEITVTGPDGAAVAGLEPAELVADDVARAGFDPIAEPGRYTVEYAYASMDGAPQQGAHQFTYVAGDDGGLELRPVLAGVVALVLAGLAVRSVLAR